jgi:rhodanese-related sulfurtransferase
VREPEEYAQVHATGAVLIPLGEVADRAGEFPTDRPFYVICRSGARSGRAVEFLRSFDLDAVNVAGGILAWMDADLPTEHG